MKKRISIFLAVVLLLTICAFLNAEAAMPSKSTFIGSWVQTDSQENVKLQSNEMNFGFDGKKYYDTTYSNGVPYKVKSISDFGYFRHWHYNVHEYECLISIPGVNNNFKCTLYYSPKKYWMMRIFTPEEIYMYKRITFNRNQY